MAKKIMENWDSIPEEYKEQALSRLMGISTGHSKAFTEKVEVKNAVVRAYTDLIRKFQDPHRTICPLCNKPFPESEETEELSVLQRTVGILPQRIKHLQISHVPIWNFIKALFFGKMPISEIATTPNPEACSEEEDLENLSEEELYDKAVQDESFRKSLFKRWIMEKQKRKTKW